MPPIVLILDSFAAVATPAGYAFMATPVLPCTPTATEPHAKRSNRQAFGAPKECNRPATPPSCGQDPMNSEKPAVALGRSTAETTCTCMQGEVTQHDPYRRMPMRRGPLRSVSRAAGGLRMPLPRMSEAIGIRLRHFGDRPGASIRAQAGQPQDVEPADRQRQGARMHVLRRLRHTHPPCQPRRRDDQHQGRLPGQPPGPDGGLPHLDVAQTAGRGDTGWGHGALPRSPRKAMAGSRARPSHL